MKQSLVCFLTFAAAAYVASPTYGGSGRVLIERTDNIAIPDQGFVWYDLPNPTGVPPGATVVEVQYRVRVVHTWLSDLRLEIFSAEDNFVVIWDHDGRQTDNGDDDDAADDGDIYLNWRTTHAFDGELVMGSSLPWTFLAQDTVPADSGYIDYVQFWIFYDSPCGPGAGDCCSANGTPGCNNASCCETVCAIDPYCCETAWDSICADEAKDLCGICPQPDLIVNDVWTTPDPPVVGEPFTIHAELCNIGDAGTGIVSIPLEYYLDGQFIDNDVLSFGLGAGECDPESTPNGIVYTSGEHQICVVIDPGNIVHESNEGNNMRCEIILRKTPTGDIVATLNNVDGANAPAQGTHFILYTSPPMHSWDQNPAIFTDIPPGTYALEGYYTGTDFGEEYWADDQNVQVFARETTNVKLLRIYPYAYQVDIFDDTTNELIGAGDVIEAGTTVRAEVPVQNDVNSSLLQSRVRFLFDRDQSTDYDYDALSAFQTFSGPGDTNLYIFTFTPSSTGQYFYALEVFTQLENGNTLRTDAWNWSPTFEVIPGPPMLVDVDVSPHLALAGWTVTLLYTIENPNQFPIDVCLGASIHLGGLDFNDITPWIDSPLCDDVVTIPPQGAIVKRCFEIPDDALAGPYTVRFTLWPVSGNQCDFSGEPYASLDDEGLLNVRRPTFGTTVITHGFQSAFVGEDLPCWALDMATAIVDRAGGLGTVLVYDPGDGAWKRPQDFPDPPGGCKIKGIPTSLDPNEELVLVFDWAQESNGCNVYGAAGTGEAAGDALYAALRDPSLPGSLAGKDLFANGVHFIGHSRGAVVNSETVQRLRRASIPVEHVTTLDPHPIEEGDFFKCAGFVDWSDPQPVTWTEVEWADNYYQLDYEFLGVPLEGQPIPGAYDFPNLDETPGGANIDHFGDNSVHQWYHGTIDLYFQPQPGGATRQSWYGGSLGWDWGYIWTQIVGGFPGPNVSGDPSDPWLGNVPSLYNGDFGFGPVEYAGWQYHGGGLSGSGEAIVGDENNAFLLLGYNDIGETIESLRHNRFWLPDNVNVLRFDYNIVAPDIGEQDDQLVIFLTDMDGDDHPIGTLDLFGPKDPTGWIEDHTLTLPPDIRRNKTYSLTFAFDAGAGVIGAAVWIDKIEFVECVLDGDINCDCVVNSVDLTLLLCCMAGDCDLPACDINGDGFVNSIDLTILLANFGAECP